MKTFLSTCRFLRESTGLEYDSVNYCLTLQIKKKTLVYAECDIIMPEELRHDKRVDIIGDTGIFLVTDKLNAQSYPEFSWEIADHNALLQYENQIINNKSKL